MIGSSCIGASVLGGVCNNSGGALVRRGPAYTELALYARVNDDGQLELVNHLGVNLGETPEEILASLKRKIIKSVILSITQAAAHRTIVMDMMLNKLMKIRLRVLMPIHLVYMKHRVRQVKYVFLPYV